MRNFLMRHLQNIPGSRTSRRFIIIESDDWGSIRMPNKMVYEDLLDKGMNPDSDPYLKYDTLESSEDLIALIGVLDSVRDAHDRPAKLTANMIVGNPDFEAIRNDNFRKYHWELFTKTLSKYSGRDGTFDTWKKGLELGVFRPQFHGREHLNVHQWMKGLKEGDEVLHEAFCRNMISISSQPSRLKYGYMEGLDYYSAEERMEKPGIIKEGIRAFETLFGYPSKTFIANCYVWDETVEKALHEMGVKYLQGISHQSIPTLNEDGSHSLTFKRRFFGDLNNLGQRYLIRNAFFEPSLNPELDWVNECLQRIEIAFRCHKPAIVGSHRVNYVGGINEENRVKNLRQLEILLKEIVKRWKNVEFISSDEIEMVWQ